MMKRPAAKRPAAKRPAAISSGDSPDADECHSYEPLTVLVEKKQGHALESLESRIRMHGGSHACPFCAKLAFPRKDRLVGHIRRCHAEGSFFGSSSKQLRIMKASYQMQIASGAVDEFWAGAASDLHPEAGIAYLACSAAIMRAMIERSPSFAALGANLEDINAITVWVLTATVDGKYVAS